jgi:hypothetical protein
MSVKHCWYVHPFNLPAISDVLMLCTCLQAYFRFRIAFYLMLLRPSVWSLIKPRISHGKIDFV